VHPGREFGKASSICFAGRENNPDYRRFPRPDQVLTIARTKTFCDTRRAYLFCVLAQFA
jgi:hypothetical protein